MKRKLLSLVCAGVLGLGLVSGAAPLVAAQTAADTKAESAEKPAEKKKPSDRTVRVIMGYAFAAIPETVPKSNGEMVKLDRSDPNKFIVPIEDARRIIRRASLSARADLCGLKDLERQHFGNIMKSEKTTKKWTPNQFIYIGLLHTTTGLVMTGNVQAGEDTKKEEDGSQDARKDYICSPQERERVKAAVEADIKALALVQ